MARLPVGLFGAGDEVGISDLFAAEVSFFEVALNPFRRGIGAPGVNQVFADLPHPQMKECVLREAALLAPRLYLKPEAVAGIQQRLNLLPDCGEVATVKFDAVCWRVPR